MQSIILASRSPRRKQILSLSGLRFVCVDFRRERNAARGAWPRGEGAMCLAARKATAVLTAHPGALCIGADTVVVHRGQVYGKPANEQQAFAMLDRLQNDVHDVYTGLCVCGGKTPELLRDFARTQVRFLPMSEGEIRRYIRTGEPFDKAGGYGIQGKACLYIHSIVGSYDNVVGLPLALLCQMLRKKGVTV